MTTSTKFIASASVLALWGAAPMAVQAQESEERQGGAVARVMEKVTVTATKKADAEDVQNVPVAVTAFNANTLDALNVDNLQALTFSAPNVSLDEIGTSRGTANFSIRGLGVNSSIPSIDPSVGVFVDGVYIGVNNGVVFDLFDLDSVELLRGPQGLLFGRNTTGGAVLLNTGNPTDELEFSARVATEFPVDSDRGGLNSTVQSVLSGPIIKDKLNGKIAAYYNFDDGYFENQLTGDNQGEAQTLILRGALEYTPTENLTLLGKFEFFDSDGDGPAAQNRGTFDRESFDFSIDNPGFYDTEIYTGSLRADLDVGFGNGTITNIFGFRDYESQTDSDIDALPVFLFHSAADFEQDQISNELRYNGTFGKAEVTTGFFFFQQDLAYDEFRFLPTVTPLDFAGGGITDHRVFGLFGSVDYSITEQLIATVGLRWSDERKDGAVSFIVPRAESCSVIGGTCPFDAVPQQEINFSNVTPKAGLQYFINDNAQVYGFYTRGFRSGGFNFRITDPAAFANQVEQTGQPFFDEETVDNFELGTKFETPDGRGQLNAAAYYTIVTDFQREVNLASPGAGVSQLIANTADADIFGLEFEGRYALTDRFLITANLGYINAEYTDVDFDLTGDAIVDGADEALDIPRVPEFTYGFGAIYDQPLGELGTLTARANFQHRDEFAYTDNNLGFINAVNNLDAALIWATPINGVEFTLYGKNLLDEVFAGGDTQVPFGGPLSTGNPVPFGNPPSAGTFSPLNKGRRLGIEATYRF